MKVIDAEAGLLSNVEVLEVLKDIKPSSSNTENLQTIIVEIQAYLRERPAGNVENPQTPEAISQFVAELRKHNLALEKAEILQIINSAPTTMPVLFCLIEEADIRFTEQQLGTIIELSTQYLGVEPVPSES